MVSWPFYAPLDALRRIAGAWLDANALGRREAPYRIVHAEPGAAPRTGGDARARPDQAGLHLGSAAARERRAAARVGFRVYLVDWARPTPNDRDLVGRNAHRDLWPEIADWMLAQAAQRTAPAQSAGSAAAAPRSA